MVSENTDEREPGDESEQEQPEASLPVTQSKPGRTFADLWARGLPIITSLIPKHIKPETIFALAVTARQRSPKLKQCTEISIVRSVIQAAQLGLDISGVGGQAYMVPYFNKRTREFEAQMQVGYKGLIELARRGGRVLYVRAREVYEKDAFQYEDGLYPVLRHVPHTLAESPGQVIAAWAVAAFPTPNGIPVMQPEVMSRPQIDLVRASSQAKDDGPWVTHYPMMARKTVIKRLCATLPQDRELVGQPGLATALDIEERAEAGEPQELDLELAALDEGPVQAETAPATRTESVKRTIKEKRSK